MSFQNGTVQKWCPYEFRGIPMSPNLSFGGSFCVRLFLVLLLAFTARKFLT